MSKRMITLFIFVFMSGGCADSPQYSLFSFESLKLNGSDEYLQSSTAPVTGYPFSVSAWVKTSSAAAQTVWSICKSSSTTSYQELSFAASGFPRVVSLNGGSGTGTSTTAINNNAWHNLIAVYASATSRTLYVDGVSKAVNATNITFDTTSNQMAIGRRCGSTASQYFSGNIDSVSIWNTALSTTNVATIYNSGKPGDLTGQSGLVSWYRFGEMRGDTPSSVIVDAKGTNNLTPVSLDSSNIVLDTP